MIDLELFKEKKKENQAVELLNGLVEIRDLYNQFLDIAHSKQGYTEEQIKEARQLTSEGFYAFVSKIMSFIK